MCSTEGTSSTASFSKQLEIITATCKIAKRLREKRTLPNMSFACAILKASNLQVLYQQLGLQLLIGEIAINYKPVVLQKLSCEIP